MSTTYRCVGGPLHGKDVQADGDSLCYYIPPEPAAMFVPGDESDMMPPLRKHWYERRGFGSGTYRSRFYVMLSEDLTRDEVEATRQLLDAFWPELAAAADGRFREGLLATLRGDVPA